MNDESFRFHLVADLGRNPEWEISGAALCQLRMHLHHLTLMKQASTVAWYSINLKGTYRFKSTGDVAELEQMMRYTEVYKPVR